MRLPRLWPFFAALVSALVISIAWPAARPSARLIAQASAPPQRAGDNHASAGDSHAADRAAIAQVLSDQQSAWNRGDVNAFLQGYWHSPELTFAGSNGFAEGWDRVMERYKKSYPDRASMGQLDFSELSYRFLGPDAALVLGHWHLARDEGDVGGVFSLVWQRFPEGWRIIHDHTSAVNAVE